MKALLCGYYGEHNIGDDALLEVLLEQLPAGWQALVTARDEELVRDRFAVATTDRRHLGQVLRALAACQALVLGGGSLLQDSTSFRSLVYYAALIVTARLQGKPVLLWGQGLGPLRRRRSRALVRSLLPLVTAASWRDPASAAQARAWGREGLEGGDPVWCLPRLDWCGSGGPIVLCWRPVAALTEERWRAWLELLDRLSGQTGRSVLWLPFHGDQDRGLLDSLAERGLLGSDLRRHSSEVIVDDPRGARQILGGAGLVIAMRLHGLILAALAGSPCAALSYDPKVTAAADAIGCPCHDLEEPVSPAALEAWLGTIDRPPPPERIAAQCRSALVHRRLLEGLPPARDATDGMD